LGKLEFTVPRPSPSTLPRSIHLRATRAKSIHVPVLLLPDDNPIKAQLERILNSRVFAGAQRSKLFLRYVVEHSLARPTEPLKEYSIALDVFDRDASYDPAVDATVRVEAGRLRSRLLEYYAGDGLTDPFLIQIPRGGYRAVFRPRQPAIAPAARPHALGPARPQAPRRRHLWAVPLAFLLGALLGHRASH
jgi:hypothetical protein